MSDNETKRVLKGVWTIIVTIMLLILAVQRVAKAGVTSLVSWVAVIVVFIFAVYLVIKLTDFIMARTNLSEKKSSNISVFVIAIIFGAIWFIFDNKIIALFSNG